MITMTIMITIIIIIIIMITLLIFLIILGPGLGKTLELARRDLGVEGTLTQY